MIYLFENKPTAKDEIKYAHLLGRVLFYEDGKIVDPKGNEVLIKETPVKLFCTPEKLEEIIEYLQSRKCILENSINDIHSIKAWYAYHTPRRVLIPYVGSDFENEDTLKEINEKFKDNIFFKTEEKDYSGEISKAELLDENSPIRKTIRKFKNKNYILSDKVNIAHDEYGNEEYRVFVRNSEVINISRLLFSTYHKIPSDVVDFSYSVVDEIDPSFATSYVIDICRIEDGSLDVIDFHPMEIATRYLYNSSIDASDDLTHEHIEILPKEHEKKAVHYNTFERIYPNMKDHNYGVFANTYFKYKFKTQDLDNEELEDKVKVIKKDYINEDPYVVKPKTLKKTKE